LGAVTLLRYEGRQAPRFGGPWTGKRPKRSQINYDKKAADSLARNLIYVAMTRAIDNLECVRDGGTQREACEVFPACSFFRFLPQLARIA
jgi:ATP-dependent exoDNAse (exonuclease V) beta subunit